jgi:hypothetical protein
MNRNSLRPQLEPIGKAMQYSLCFVFLFLAASLSISWQVQWIFMPLYAEKIQINVNIDSQCANHLTSTQGYQDIPENCLKCSTDFKDTNFKSCDFSTVGNGSADVARTFIKKRGLVFSIAGYLYEGRLYLRYYPYPLLLVHIPIWFFGLIPIFAFAYKKPRYS